MRSLYLALALLGAVLPWIFFGRFLASPDPTAAAFLRQLFVTDPAAGFSTDLLITSVVFWIWSFRETRRAGMTRWWPYPVLNLLVGLSCALPLFLWVRAGRHEG